MVIRAACLVSDHESDRVRLQRFYRYVENEGFCRLPSSYRPLHWILFTLSLNFHGQIGPLLGTLLVSPGNKSQSIYFHCPRRGFAYRQC